MPYINIEDSAKNNREWKQKNRSRLSIYARNAARAKVLNVSVSDYRDEMWQQRVDERKEKSRQNKRAFRRSQSKRKAAANKEMIWDYKLQSGCGNCPENDPACLVFHHRDPQDKLFEIGKNLKKYASTLKREMEKCDVLCSNCHAKLHHYGSLKGKVSRPIGTVRDSAGT